MILNDILERATKEHWALGHFNVSNLEQMRVIARVCKAMESPAMIGTSEGERGFIGVRQAVALIRSLREEYD